MKVAKPATPIVTNTQGHPLTACSTGFVSKATLRGNWYFGLYGKKEAREGVIAAPSPDLQTSSLSCCHPAASMAVDHKAK
jgi:hypothetical protein